MFKRSLDAKLLHEAGFHLHAPPAGRSSMGSGACMHIIML